MTATTTTSSASGSPFASSLRAPVEQDHRAVPAHRRSRNWHGAVQTSVANPRRTRGLSARDADGFADVATRLRRAVD